MYVSMKESLLKARQGNYCIPATAVENEHSIRACVSAAEEMHSPIILIALYKVIPDILSFGRIVRDIAMSASVPVSMCLDHGGTYEEAMMAIRAGYTDVMVDFSNLPLEENIAAVQRVVEVAHAVGVGVEAELGHVGMADDEDLNAGLTDPKEAEIFVEKTQVDALAVAVGTAHGTYKGEPELQFDLLKTISEQTKIPLVLHGGSGTGDKNLAEAIKLGICKLNISNDLKRSAIRSLLSVDTNGMGAYRMYPLLFEGYRDCTKRYIEICGSKNKA